MASKSTMSPLSELNSFVTKFHYLCSAGFKASLTLNSSGDGRARVAFEVELGFLQPPVTVPPPVSPSSKQRRSPAYNRRLKKRREARQKLDNLYDANLDPNDSITVTEEVRKQNVEIVGPSIDNDVKVDHTEEVLIHTVSNVSDRDSIATNGAETLGLYDVKKANLEEGTVEVKNLTDTGNVTNGEENMAYSEAAETIEVKGILSHIHKPYLKDRHFCPDHNYTLENLKNFFIWEKKGKN